MTQPEGAPEDVCSTLGPGCRETHTKNSCCMRDHSSCACAAVNQPCRSPLWKPFDFVHAHEDKQHHSVGTLPLQYRFSTAEFLLRPVKHTFHI